jgi:DNA-binding protein HU-beta
LEDIMTQAEMLKEITQATGLGNRPVTSVLASLGKLAMAEIKNGGEVPFPGGLGKLVVVATAARARRNPRTGAPVQIPAGRAARFRPGKALKEALKD